MMRRHRCACCGILAEALPKVIRVVLEARLVDGAVCVTAEAALCMSAERRQSAESAAECEAHLLIRQTISALPQ